MICAVSVDLSSDSDDSDDESSVSTGGDSVSSSESFSRGVLMMAPVMHLMYSSFGCQRYGNTTNLIC